jgi:hypothetical protein
MAVVKAVTCPVCGCLCDDIELTVKKGKIVKVKNGCALCESKFLGYGGHRILKPLVRKNDELIESSFETAVKRAAKILAEKGVNVLALDKRQEIGVPVRCGEGLGMGWFERLNLKPNPAWAVAPMKGAALWSPSGKSA